MTRLVADTSTVKECNNRAGYEFSHEQKEMARKKANGKCQFPAYECPSPNNAHVGHLTGIADGRARGVCRASITSDDNMIVQCEKHDRYLDEQQATLLIGIRKNLFPNPFIAGELIWLNRR